MLLIDKPQGLSSNEALQRAKRLLNARKAGHTGSLDPLATGLLPLCFGETTKISSFFLEADKEYQVTIKLGSETTTGDSQGAVVRQAPVNVDINQINEALTQFRGEYEQVPPMHSALKLNGQPLYKLARKGVKVERRPRKVHVYALILNHWEGDVMKLTVTCSRGFYVRTLAEEIGKLLTCGGHVVQLRRTKVGIFDLTRVVTLDQLELIISPREREQLLMPTDTALINLPKVILSANIAVYLCQGQSVRVPQLPPNQSMVRVYSENEQFLGIGEVTKEGEITPKRLFYS